MKLSSIERQPRESRKILEAVQGIVRQVGRPPQEQRLKSLERRQLPQPGVVDLGILQGQFGEVAEGTKPLEPGAGDFAAGEPHAAEVGQGGEHGHVGVDYRDASPGQIDADEPAAGVEFKLPAGRIDPPDGRGELAIRRGERLAGPHGGHKGFVARRRVGCQSCEREGRIRSKRSLPTSSTRPKSALIVSRRVGRRAPSVAWSASPTVRNAGRWWDSFHSAHPT